MEETTLARKRKNDSNDGSRKRQCRTERKALATQSDNGKAFLKQELAALDVLSFDKSIASDTQNCDMMEAQSTASSVNLEAPERMTVSEPAPPKREPSKKKGKKSLPVYFPMGILALDRLYFLGDLLLRGIDESWRRVIERQLYSFQGFHLLHRYAAELMTNKLTLPPLPLVFQAFRLSKFQQTRVIILGQDPYHRPGQAMGLAFSVPRSLTKLPPSLKNIYAELGISGVEHGDLTSWASQGVLLLNPVLTVSEGQPNSHAHMGWQWLTDKILETLSQEGNKVFMLWGTKAKEKVALICPTNNLTLQAAHPSPLATKGDFKGCGHFSSCNVFLKERGFSEIDWRSVCETG